MTDNRNTSSGLCQDGRGIVCIDTKRVMDSCRDRDCFENVRVYLTAAGEEVLNQATNIRARSAKIDCAFVGVDEVPFNCGFYQVTVRYYISVEIEACIGGGRSQMITGVAAVEKQVILFGGEGTVTTFTSNAESGFCSVCNDDNRGTNGPAAIVETVEPIVLGTKIGECGCINTCCEAIDLPECIKCLLNGDLCFNSTNPRIYMSFGVFSVIRIVRNAQLLVQATDYSVPDKECVAASNNDDPCSVFSNMPFPASSFRGTRCNSNTEPQRNTRGNCCNK